MEKMAKKTKLIAVALTGVSHLLIGVVFLEKFGGHRDIIPPKPPNVNNAIELLANSVHVKYPTELIECRPFV